MTTGGSPFDIVIAGASFTGLALAKALSVASGTGLRIALIDHRSGDAHGAPTADSRAFALSAGSRYFLQHIGLWPALVTCAQPVEKIEITDSSLDAGVRPRLLSWANILANGDPASYIVPAQHVLSALADAVKAESAIVQMRGRTISSIDHTGQVLTLSLDDGRALTAKLLIASDGQNSPLRQKAGLKIVRWDYAQKGIVTTISHDKPHEATAIQHFLPGGPFAILPLTGNRSCITWSEDADEADRIMALDDAGFARALDQRLAGRLGAFEVVGPTQTWPLSCHLARDYVKARIALVGDAAHGVHPIAGQGLNLGLRDVAALTDVIVEGASLGLDYGQINILQRYETWRRTDSALNAVVFDGLNRMFSNDVALLRSVREVGLGSVDRMDGLKAFFVREAAGQSGDVPSLMRKDVA